MISVGIVTVFRTLLLTNYGSFFQHCALRRVLRELGCNSFRCEDESIWTEIFLYCLPLRLLRIQILNWFGLHDAPRWRSVALLPWRFRFYVDYRRFVGKLFEKRLKSESLVYVAGGDTVWANAWRFFFLSDRVKTNKCVSYAASALWDAAAKNIEWQRLAGEALPQFAALSVREEVGAEIVRKITGRDVFVAVDPVLLLRREELLNFASRKRMAGGKMLLYYSVNASTEAELNFESVLDCADQMGCALSAVGIQGSEFLMPARYRRRPSPARFLAMLRDADCVVTQSFHGIVFSVLLNRSFVFVSQCGHGRGNENIRQFELLSKLGLLNRMVEVGASSATLTGVLKRPIDWARVNLVLDQERERCREWLAAAIR